MAEVAYKTRKQDLGIYYTPEPVVAFVFDILNVLKKKQDEESARWESHEPNPHYPSVIDPAVGEGIFLKMAIESGFTKPRYVFGVDIDEHVVEQWERINLLKSFGSRADLENHFFNQDGLRPLNHDRILPYKRGGLKEFDAVVGNPPYGGCGLAGLNLKGEPAAYYGSFELVQRKYANSNNNLALGDFRKPVPAEKLTRYPIELLFIERFIQLAKPGGWIAIIIPDGILANSSLQYVREFIVDRAKVLAIVSLPRETFKQVGTNAKTSILFLRKYREGDDRDLNYRVFLASISKLDEQGFDLLTESFEEFHYDG